MTLNSPAISGDRRTTEAIVRVDELWKTYQSGWLRSSAAVDALRGVTLEAYPGEVFGLLGPNGAGKTTLIKTLLGVIRPTKGNASLFGLPLGDASARMRVGYLPESLRVDKHHTARTALRYYGRLSRLDRPTIARRTDELLELVGLHHRDKETVRRFSKGMYQRLGLAQALMHDPDLLVLDEPTDGLDPVGRNEVRMVIERLRDMGKTVFLNSHILQEVELVCTRVAVMARGEIQAIGSVEEVVGQTQRRYEFTVTGSAADDLQPTINGLLSTLPVRDIIVTEVNGPAVLKINLEAAEDGPRLVDQIIDAFRAADVSILQFAPVRVTLEQAFMRLVGDKTTGVHRGQKSADFLDTVTGEAKSTDGAF